MRRFQMLAFALLATSVLFAFPSVASAAPSIAFLKNTGPIAYDLKSLQTTRFYTSVDSPNVYAVLKLKRATGDVILYKGAIAEANKNFYFPLWNGFVSGKRLPTATYDVVLSVTKGGQTSTKTTKIIISRICFNLTGDFPGSGQEARYAYMIAGSANFYGSFSTADPEGAYAEFCLDSPLDHLPLFSLDLWPGYPVAETNYLRPGDAPYLTRGIQKFFVHGANAFRYSVTVIQ